MDFSTLDEVLAEAIELGRSVATTGKVAQYIPELSRADPSIVAAAVHSTDGVTAHAGDVSSRFTLQSVSKAFALACLLRDGEQSVFDNVSMEPSGDAFHSIVRLEEERGRPRNPLINAGAIVVSGRLPGESAEDKVQALRAFLNRAGGNDENEFPLDSAVFASECQTGFRNRALANYMKHFGVIEDPEVAVETYFRQCSLTCDVTTLARTALFLANGGMNPDSGNRLLSRENNRTILALMTTCGLYDEVGRFAVRVGMPAKSGVSGAIVGVVPGRMAIACYGPALGPKGNSVAGIRILEHITRELGLSIFERS